VSWSLLKRVVRCLGTGDVILMPEASDSDSSVRGCKTKLLLLAVIPGDSETGSGKGRT
jgi:hypothetical protein